MSVSPKVLIVDDHDGFHALAGRVLTSAGFDVVGEAADAGSALEAAGLLQPELVILDVQLPDLDGFEVAARLAALEPSPAIVLVSTRDTHDYGTSVGESRTAGFIAKEHLSGARVLELLSAWRDGDGAGRVGEPG